MHNESVKISELFKPTTSLWLRLTFLAVATLIIVGIILLLVSDNKPYPAVAGLLALLGLGIYAFTIYGLVVENRGTVGDRARAMRDGLPDSQFITWQTSDGESHVATQVTIDGATMWRHDGETLSAAQILELTEGAPVRQL
jgi:hypothetical protein